MTGAVGAVVTAPLTLRADGVISGTGIITATDLVIRGTNVLPDPESRAGSVNLTGNNAVGTLNARATGGIVFHNALALTVAGTVLGGSVALDAPGGLLINAPVEATLGGVTLTTGAGGLIQQTVPGTVTAPNGQTITLTADELILAAVISANADGLVEITRASAGNIVIGAGAPPTRCWPRTTSQASSAMGICG